MTTQQPEALRLAEKLHEGICSLTVVMQPAAAMLRAQHARIAELEASLVKESARTASEKRRADQMSLQHDMQAALNSDAREQLAALNAAPQAVQADVPLPLLVRDIARELGITVPQACIALKPLGNYSTNSAVTGEMARMLHDHFPAPAHPAGGVPAQASEWDGKLPERLQSVLNALRLELPAAVVNDVEFEVRSHYEAMHTSLSTSRRMYGAARDRLEAIDAAQPDPFAATQPAAQGMEALRKEIENLTRLLPANVDCSGVWAALDAAQAKQRGA